MKAPKQTMTVEHDCYTIDDFCRSHRLSKSMYFRLRRAGKGPAEMKFESKVLISKEAAARWRKQRTTEAAA